MPSRYRHQSPQPLRGSVALDDQLVCVRSLSCVTMAQHACLHGVAVIGTTTGHVICVCVSMGLFLHKYHTHA